MDTINIPFYDDMLLAGPFPWEIIGILFGIALLLSAIFLLADSFSGSSPGLNGLKKREGIIMIVIGLLILSIAGRMFYKDFKDIEEFTVISSESAEVVKTQRLYTDKYQITFIKDDVISQSKFVGKVTISNSSNATQATVLKVENKYGYVIDDYIYELIVPKNKILSILEQ
ncbi:hypothetical protein [Desulfitobacterium chlororespirans]|uniref:Uncharacterized protein n=1 Tax=Desulfitobacterium chlororespirans DSM 11544 TaxID=1121395 RepID=A0A1M7UYB3_9FIRM|nr:hypothetical protein [Desulfitobacterium chlororespirans]SHN87983.1 hypothetical protein SAMN02745215_05065 [Desulfitobacterium chlororespirans DSM 11544]